MNSGPPATQRGPPARTKQSTERRFKKPGLTDIVLVGCQALSYAARNSSLGMPTCASVEDTRRKSAMEAMVSDTGGVGGGGGS